MKTIKLTGIIEAIGPIAHNGNEKSGNSVLLRRIDMITANGKRMSVPYIEGNALRGKLRRILMKDFFEQLGIEEMNARLYYMFYSGGNLESVSNKEGQIDLKLKKQIYSLIPPLSLLGTSFLNQILTGKISVGKIYPLCEELKHFVKMYGFTAEKYAGLCTNLLSFNQLTAEQFQTRRDDRNVESDNKENPIQMKVESEVFIPGSKFLHCFNLRDLNPVEESCFHHLLNLWKADPAIGGKSSIGNGDIYFEYDGSEELEKPDLYLEFISSKKKEILALIKELTSVSEEQSSKKKKSSKVAKDKNADANLAEFIIEGGE